MTVSISSGFIGSVSFSGSLIAFAKLQGLITKSVRFSGQKFVNLAILLIAALTYHSYLGTAEVIEDYVRAAGSKIFSLVLLRFAYVLAGGASIFAILRVAFGPLRP